MAHIGSWGLPDFGLTERLGGLLGGGYTAQGGSNISSNVGSYPTAITNQQQPIQGPGLGWGGDVYSPIASPAPSGGGGQTLGVNTGGQASVPTSFPSGGQPSGDPNPQPSGPSAEELARNAMRGSIENTYSQVFSQLDSMAGMLPDWQKQKQKSIDDLFASQKTEIDTAKEGELGKFGGYREQVATMQGQSIKDLAENMRKLLQAGNIYLGTRGAGDSSAAGMYNYALTKEGNKGRAAILNQANQMYNELNMKQADIENTFNQQIAQLNTWKADQVSQLGDWVNNMKWKIEQAKVGATQEKAQALNQMEMNLMNNALQRLQALDQQATQWGAAMKEWAVNRLASIDDYKMKLGQMGQWSPTQIVQQELQGINAPQQTQGGQDFWLNPYAQARKKEEEQFRSMWG
jgi:hypothetical protein